MWKVGQIAAYYMDVRGPLRYAVVTEVDTSGFTPTTRVHGTWITPTQRDKTGEGFNNVDTVFRTTFLYILLRTGHLK
jgi:hypothetical protein